MTDTQTQQTFQIIDAKPNKADLKREAIRQGQNREWIEFVARADEFFPLCEEGQRLNDEWRATLGTSGWGDPHALKASSRHETGCEHCRKMIGYRSAMRYTKNINEAREVVQAYSQKRILTVEKSGPAFVKMGSV